MRYLRINRNISIVLQAVMGTVIAMVVTSILLSVFDNMGVGFANSGTFCNILLDCMIILAQVIILLANNHKVALSDVGIELRKVNYARLGLVMLAALFVVFASYGIILMIGEISFEGLGFAFYKADVVIKYVLLLLIQMVFVAVAEEIAFRGVIANCIKKEFGGYKALLVSTVIFTVFHCTVIHSVTQVTDIFVLGLLLGLFYIKTGSLLYSIGFHFVIDFATNLFTLKGNKALFIISTDYSERYLESLLFGMMTALGLLLIIAYFIRSYIEKKNLEGETK